MMDLNYLQHHGVKGQKWGVRRYQNEDGTLTPAGRKRYSDDDEVAQKKAAYKTANKEYNKAWNKAYNKSIAGYSPIKKHREANDKRWEDAYDKAQAANKAKEEYKQAKTQRIKNAVKQHKKATDEFYKLDEIASAKWTEAEAQYAALGKNRVQRMMTVINTQKGRTDAAKNYLKTFNEAEAASNLADTKWSEVNELYRNTGKNRISRVINNAKYWNGR